MSIIEIPLDDAAPFDPAPYAKAPIFSLLEGLSLSRALTAACPSAMPAFVKKAAGRLDQRAAQTETALLNRQRTLTALSEEDSRQLDTEIDATWAGLRDRLQGLAALPSGEYKEAARATELLTLLFGGEGLAFTKTTYAAQLTAMELLLRRIDQDKLAGDLDRLCGPMFLTHLRKLLPRYQRMVRSNLQRDGATGADLREYRMALARSVVAYATAVCGSVDEDDPKTLALARVALQPLDGHRAAAANRRSDPNEPAPADPEVPPQPPS